MKLSAPRIANLIYSYLQHSLTSDEEAELELWINESPENKKYFDEILHQLQTGKLQAEFEQPDGSRIWAKVMQGAPELQQPEQAIHRLKWPQIAAAAVLLIAFCSWAVFRIYHSSADNNKSSSKIQYADIEPGTDKAMLTLANGQRLILDSLNSGELYNKENIRIVKNTKGEIEYQSTVTQPQEATATAMNSISTPRGGRYQVLLPDGSRVWLNAASYLKFPTAFSRNQREVVLCGEGYFEIKPVYEGDKKVPFTVKVVSENGTMKGNVNVLGTHFNVHAYEGQEMKTTLMEGKVRVVGTTGDAITLNPGQMAIQDNNGSRLQENADLESIRSWVNGDFIFNDASLFDIMHEIGNWYDVKISYNTNVEDKHFSFNISRNIPLSKILQVLEMTGSVHFEVNNKTISVKQ